MKASAKSHQDLHVPWATLVKIFAAVVAGWALVRLWPSVQLFLISVLLAVALSPIVDGLERHGVAHGRAVSLLALSIVLILVVFCFFVLPPFIEQRLGRVDRLRHGNRLKLSKLTVLLAILAGGTLGGVIGAVLALPIVAAYPVFEKHWLDDYLSPDAVEDHRALRDTDGKESEAVVDAVLQGAAPRT